MSWAALASKNSVVAAKVQERHKHPDGSQYAALSQTLNDNMFISFSLAVIDPATQQLLLGKRPTECFTSINLRGFIVITLSAISSRFCWRTIVSYRRRFYISACICGRRYRDSMCRAGRHPVRACLMHIHLSCPTLMHAPLLPLSCTFLNAASETTFLRLNSANVMSSHLQWWIRSKHDEPFQFCTNFDT